MTAPSKPLRRRLRAITAPTDPGVRLAPTSAIERGAKRRSRFRIDMGRSLGSARAHPRSTGSRPAIALSSFAEERSPDEDARVALAPRAVARGGASGRRRAPGRRGDRGAPRARSPRPRRRGPPARDDPAGRLLHGRRGGGAGNRAARRRVGRAGRPQRDRAAARDGDRIARARDPALRRAAGAAYDRTQSARRQLHALPRAGRGARRDDRLRPVDALAGRDGARSARRDPRDDPRPRARTRRLQAALRGGRDPGDREPGPPGARPAGARPLLSRGGFGCRWRAGQGRFGMPSSPSLRAMSWPAVAVETLRSTSRTIPSASM